MEISAAEPQSETEADRSPLLMERQVNRSDDEHIIDISRISNASSSLSHDDLPHEDRPSSSSHEVAYQTASSPNRANARNYSFTRRNEGYTRRSRSPLNSGLWISVELVVTLGQIIAAIVVLSLSTDENPQAPLVAWIVGYASGCVAMLPILYWRYRNRNRGNPSQSNRGSEEDTTRLRSSLSQNNLSSEPASSTAVSVTRPSEQQNQQTTILASTNGHISRILNTRLSGLVDHLKMALDCFFAVWFVVGNVWIFGGHSSPSDAPKLYRY